MNKKIILAFILLLGAVSASFAQGGEVIAVGERFFVKTTTGEMIPVLMSKEVFAGLKSTAVNAGAKGAVLGENGAVTAEVKSEKPVVRAAKINQTAKQEQSNPPYKPELKERIEKAFPLMGKERPADLFAYDRIENAVKEGIADPVTEEDVLKLQQDYLFMREQWNLLVLKNGLDNVHKVRMALSYKLQKGVDAQLAGAYAQLDKFIGKNLHFPQKGTPMRVYIDGQLARFPEGIYVSDKIKYLKYLSQQQDFWDGVIASAPNKFYSNETPRYDFVPALKTMQEKYGDQMPASAFKNDRDTYIALEDAIIFKSVGAPAAHITEKFSTLEKYPFGAAIFQVPEELQRAYTESVYDRLDDFIKKNSRYPYFSADPAAKEYVFNRVSRTLTDEARLALAVRRCLAFPENSESRWLKNLVEEGKALPGTQAHDAKLPAVTY